MGDEDLQERINTLKNTRDCNRAKLAGFTKFVADFDHTVNSIEELQLRIEKIDKTFSDFDDLSTTLEVIDTSATKIKNHRKERQTFEAEFYESIGKAKRLVSQYQVASFQLSASNVLSPPQPVVRDRINLPPINLPTFDGRRENWSQFHDAFKALIHEDQRTPDSTKLRYLKGCLSGSAKSIIEHYETTDDNYIIAWDLLCNRFRNIRITVNHHLKSLFDMPSVSVAKQTSLRKLLDELERHMRSLKNLRQPTDSWDTIVIYLISSKLDFQTKKEWEQYVSNTTQSPQEFPTYIQFISFLSDKCQLLETLDNYDYSKQSYNQQTQYRKAEKSDKKFSHLASNKKFACYFCKKGHYIYTCSEFLKLSPEKREAEIRKLNLCINCFKSDHVDEDNCPSTKCKLCHKKHNTLLHYDSVVSQAQALCSGNLRVASATETTATVVSQNYCSNNNFSGSTRENESVMQSSPPASQTLLSTAVIHIGSLREGREIRARCILDSGSMSNFITTSLAKRLGISLNIPQTSVSGVSGCAINIRGQIRTSIKSTQNNFQSTLDFLVIDKITGKIPCMSFNFIDLKLPDNVILADPTCHISGEIDALLGADIFYELLCKNKIHLGKDRPILYETKLGYILSGSLNLNKNNCENSFCNLTSRTDNFEIQGQLERFWLIEECQTKTKIYSEEEREVEEHFIKNTRRDSSGQFVVQLPVSDNITNLGLYSEFMSEYIDMEHMSLVPVSEINNKNTCYYLPHHGVLKQSSLTTKLRTVFEASAKSSTGLSLNDVLKVGPVIQDDLFSILTRFRKYNYVISADIAKMFRCVAVEKEQRDLQRIIWRSDPSQDLKIYRLNTVTYGQACSSFLAIRCLFQVGIESEETFPEASRAIKRDFYCDDFLSGSDTIDGCIQLRREVSDLLENSKFLLRKWASNEPSILQDSQTNDIFQYIINDDKELKTLGILWDTKLDVFGFSVEFEIPSIKNVTKRIILSIISRLFDPLGLAGPVLIQAKLILQDLWKLSLSWDETVPPDIQNYFINFCEDLKCLVNIKIPRQAILKNAIHLQIHGFCDSSEKSYGACVMLRSEDLIKNCTVSLLCAKARIAPLKTQTLPRLELMGAVILSRLVDKVVKALEIDLSESDMFYWTDSTIVLSWLHSEPSNLKCFVANRVAEVQRLTKIKQWRHVRSHDNPADIISRGSTPSSLLESKLWWEGPHWLVLSPDNWPKPLDSNETKVTDLPEKRKDETTSLLLTRFQDFDLFTKLSSFTKLQRICAYLMRFIHNLSCKRQNQENKMIYGPLSIQEYKMALLKLTLIAQTQMFAKDIQELQSHKKLSRDSKILSLNPFLDESGLLRVGGRIKHSDLGHDHKHPLLISSKHPFSLLIIQYEHIRHFHAGAQATLSAIRQQFWLINGRNAVRAFLRSCIICFKANPIPNVLNQMADLPERRVKPARAFLKSGVDLAGPFLIKDGKNRNRQMIKAYLCVFICLVTKAVHFEICTDLTSETFIAVLKRFISRRGICQSFLSDNGSNFIGARRELRETYQLLQKIHKDVNILNFLRENYISWELIPPRAPHFGGIWESAVKSAKHHLKRVAANAHLTFEHFYTLVVEIEAILNSRPLTPLSFDVNDLQVLTPAHFLIGDSLKAVPDHYYIEMPMNRLSQYQRIQKMYQQFWRRWKNEYLTNLQQRTKWKMRENKAVKVGAMVIVKEDNTLPMHWPIGRITEVFPGKDQIVRVVNVRTKGGIIRRPTSKICILPLSDQV